VSTERLGKLGVTSPFSGIDISNPDLCDRSCDGALEIT
jgi:hypothetical protein